MDTIAELTAFFADLTSRSEATRFRGIELETFYGGPPRGALSLLSSVFEAAATRSSGGRRGIHARVWLPLEVGVDLLLESRARPEEGDDPLDRHFTWSATSERRMRAYLEGPLLEALVQLRAQFAIQMSDRELVLGPFLGAPAESAAAIASLVDALPLPPDGLREAAELPRGEDAEPVSVATTTSRMEADLWRSVLEASQIPCMLRGYEQSPPWGSATPMRPIDVVVPAVHRQRAAQIIEEAGQAEPVGEFCYNCGATLPGGAQWCPECRTRLETDSTDPPEKL